MQQKKKRTRIQNRISRPGSKTTKRLATVKFAKKFNKSISTGTIDRGGMHKKCYNFGPDPELRVFVQLSMTVHLQCVHTKAPLSKDVSPGFNTPTL
jgi:hypothetical protein